MSALNPVSTAGPLSEAVAADVGVVDVVADVIADAVVVAEVLLDGEKE